MRSRAGTALLVVCALACEAPASDPPAPDAAPFLAAAESASVRPPPSACGPVHVVVLGSSTAAGIGPADSANAWVSRYRRHLQADPAGHRLTSLALGGYNTFRLLPSGLGGDEDRLRPDTTRNIDRALAIDADAIVINLPSNDANLGIDVATQLANYDTIVARAAAAGVPVWVTTTQPRDFDADRRANAFAMRDSTLARFGGRAIDFFTGLGRPDGTISAPFGAGDGVHLNDAAHAVLFARVADARIPESVSCGVAPTAPQG
ncbi:MAG TPA: SGNH/GDSL hydrolase family protein [Longimicrobiales bacterium]|nr:SGNH/GDSL hydrolase family protein [Longimicrobiales bacterium]